MTLDLLHNKIIKETLTEGFERSVNDNLIPKLYALYGASLDGVQFYEDYINDDFIKDGYWYYPLTVVIGGIYAVLWIKWDISREGEFIDGNPYTYAGEGTVDFLLADDIPIAFKNSIEGRGNYFEGGHVKLNVTTDAPNPKILAGKYSQTFIDEMNRQISLAISRACGVKGLAESSIELDIVFAQNTYMEHTSENVTYRRLLISAKGCAARDFWIKWTRNNSSVAYSVNDNVTAEDVVFELGEDVPQKVREKEYRFLIYGNSDKYRVAMGRKNVTEWRELIKRAVKRGELFKTTSELEETERVSEVSDKLSEILEKCGVNVPVSTSNDIKVEAEAANEALRLAVLGNGESESENYVPEIPVATEPQAEPEAVYSAEELVIEESETEEPEAEETEIEESETEEPEAEETEIEESETEEPEAEETVAEELEITDVIDTLDDDAGEFDFGKVAEELEIAEDSEEELSFEDILEQFIPKSDEDGEEDGEDEQYEAEIVDISTIDESESVRFNIDKTGDAPFDLDDAQEEDSLPELEVELYADEESEEQGEEEIENEDETEFEEQSEEEAEELDSVPEYDEAKELSVSYTERQSVYATPTVTPVYEIADTLRLENEIANLRHQLETERIEREIAEAKLEEALVEKINVENELVAEREAKEEAELKLRSAEVAKENAESQMNLELLAAADLRAQNEKQKFAIEQVKKLVEEETAARVEAEAELELLRSEVESLRADNEHLKEVARVSEEACREAEEECKRHERELLNQIELTEKVRVREKNLFAEAARQAKEENEQRFAELKEAEIARIEEEARIEALRRAEDERLRMQDELRFASEALENEETLKAIAEENRIKDIENRAREARLRMEERARINAEAKASSSSEYASVPAPVYENTAAIVENEPEQIFAPIADIELEEPIVESVGEEDPIVEPEPAPVINYTYTSYIVRLMFRRSADPNVTARIHEMISYALTDLGKDNIYMKVKASMPDNYTVVLNFVKFPEEEFDLLVKIINYLGKSDLGVYKVVLD